MISIKTISIGESNYSPLINTFNFFDKTEEIIFYNAINVIKEKLKRSLKININEALIIFCDHIVKGFKSGLSVKEIENTAYKVLSSNDVMIGVPELMRKTIFEVIVDDIPEKQIVLNEPIRIDNYLLAKV